MKQNDSAMKVSPSIHQTLYKCYILSASVFSSDYNCGLNENPHWHVYLNVLFKAERTVWEGLGSMAS